MKRRTDERREYFLIAFSAQDIELSNLDFDFFYRNFEYLNSQELFSNSSATTRLIQAPLAKATNPKERALLLQKISIQIMIYFRGDRDYIQRDQIIKYFMEKIYYQ